MTLADIKKQVLSLIEEYDEDAAGFTNDNDIKNKLNYVINQVQTELAQIKRILTTKEYTVTSTTLSQALPTDFYQAYKVIECDYEILDGKIKFEDGYSGKANLYYFKYPTTINAESLDTVTMELPLDCLTALVYGVAADLLKADVSANSNIYATRYQELKNELRVASSTPMIYGYQAEEYAGVSYDF